MVHNAGYGYRSLPLLGIASMIVATAVAWLSYIAERRSGVTPPAPRLPLEQPVS